MRESLPSSFQKTTVCVAQASSRKTRILAPAMMMNDTATPASTNLSALAASAKRYTPSKK